jgi:nucleotide-binding universal stress UspA family protein
MPDESNCSPYILVADDYSAEARAAADAALQIARNEQLEIHGLYVVDEVLALDTYANYHAELPLLPRKLNGERRQPASRAELISWFETHGKLALNWLQAAGTAAGVPVTTNLLAGGIPEMVIRSASGAQMLALGRRGNSHQDEAKFLGHNFRKIAHHVHLPMLIGGMTSHPLHRLLLACHGLAHADEALVWTARLQQDLSAEVFVLSVCQDARSSRSGTGSEEIRARLERSNLGAYRLLTGNGRAFSEIAAAAAANDVDLIVLSRYRYSALVEWLAGNTVDRLLRKTPLPLLIA